MEQTFPILLWMQNLPALAVVMARIGGLMIHAPLLGEVMIPIKIRALFCAALSLLILPFVDFSTVDAPRFIPLLMFSMGCELLVGMAIGFVLRVAFTGLQLGGHMISQQAGIHMGNVYNPAFETETDLVGELYYLLALVIFLLFDGHHFLITALIRTFSVLPPLSIIGSEALLDMFVAVLQSSFILAVKVAAPVMIALFLSSLTLGFISRTVPQMNVLAVGFSLKIGLAFIVAIAGLGVAMDIFLTVADDVLDRVVLLFGG